MSQTSPTGTVVVTGASGLVGTPLTEALELAGYRVLRAVRGKVKDPELELPWDPAKGEIDRERLEGCEAVVHLAGENIAAKRWTESFKRKIRDSRVQGTQLIARTLAELKDPPKTFCSASASGYYGDRGDEILTESSAPGDDFLARVCQEWEQACQPARDAQIRVANVRISMVLSTQGGALKEMLTPFKLGAGGVLGSGRQYMSWIVLDDLVRGIVQVVQSPQLAGPVNLASPHPVTNREFTKTLGAVLGRPTILPMPAFAARVIFGEMADALLLSSTRVQPEVLTQHGFQYKFPRLDQALEHLLKR
jgi:uncharacterized protein (TIGR01777 family)